MRIPQFLFTVSACLMLAESRSATLPTPESFAARYSELTAQKGRVGDAERLHKLFELQWEYNMTESPEAATELGFAGQNDRWGDISWGTIERRRREIERPLAVLASIDPSKLSKADQLNFDLFQRRLKEDKEAERFNPELLPINQMGGVQQELAQVISLMPAEKTKDYEDIIARLKGTSNVVLQTITLLKKGIEQGMTPPKITLRDVPQQVKNQIVADPLQSPMLQAFSKFPAGIAMAEQNRLREEAARAYRESASPAFQQLLDYLEQNYLPAARETTAISALPQGADWYAFRVRQATTTDLTPSEIHAIGLSEVKRIRAEMDKVIAKSGFKGSFGAFNEFLRTDSRFYFEKPEELLAAYRDIAKRVDPELARMFGTLPRLPYGVLPVPSYAEKSQTTAYYQPGTATFGRAGYFFANTYDLRSRPKWEMEALTLHEAVPGHHLQISLAQEMKEMPEFRRNETYTAFVEGWGLYSESLGEEMGFYTDPYSKYGQLTYEMWRAIRLVVDTGMHSLGWSRQRAIDYFKENAGKAEHDIVVEIDRYIVWPGQALAYKIGELKIKELRELARRELGDRFDIRAFHDQVLANGAVPLSVLEKHIREWIRTFPGTTLQKIG